MTGSRVGHYAESGQPPGFGGGGWGPGRDPEYPGPKTGLHFIFHPHHSIRKTIAHPIDAISGFLEPVNLGIQPNGVRYAIF